MTLIRTSMCHFLSTYSVLLVCVVMLIIDEDWGNYVFVDYNIGNDGVNNGESIDDDDDDKSSSLYQCRA